MAASSAVTAKCANRARIGRPSASATDRSAMSMAAAPSVVCDELPAVMSGAVSGSQCCAGGSAASASAVEVRRMPSSTREDLPGERPILGLDRHRDGLALEMSAVPARRGPAVRLEGVGVHLLPGDPVAIGQDLAHPELGPQAAVDRASMNEGGNGPTPPRALEASGTRLMTSTPHATTRS